MPVQESSWRRMAAPPVAGRAVLVFYLDGLMYAQGVAYLIDGAHGAIGAPHWRLVNGREIHNVTHWMPLPADPPENERAQHDPYWRRAAPA